MSRELPILFNTQMVKAILEGHKTVTRRPLKHKPLPNVGDKLWVRETFVNWGGKSQHLDGYYVDYRADFSDNHHALKGGFDEEGDRIPPISWSPSIHMPRKYARLFLSVESVTEENVLDITEMDAINEGFKSRDEFLKAWMKLYGSLNMPCHVIRFRWLK